MVAVILHVANTIAARATWAPDDVVPRLRSGDLALHICQQLLGLGQGQPQFGDIAKAIRPADLHEIRAWILTLGASFNQPQNPCHAPTPGPRSGVKIPNSSRHPQFRRGPYTWPLSEGFRHFVTSMPAPVVSGWSGCWAGLAPAGE